MCKDCRKQFVANPKKQKISDEKKELTDRLLLEKISLAGIAGAVLVSEKWLPIIGLPNHYIFCPGYVCCFH